MMDNPIFFESLGLPKDAKIGIDGLERVIPRAKHSHNLGWVSLCRNQLISAGWKNVSILKNVDDDEDESSPKVPESYNEYDAIIFYLGVSYNGAINYFFGVDDNVVKRFKRIQDFNGSLFVMNFDMPMIGESISGRWNNKSTSKNISQLNPDLLDQACRRTKRFDYIEKSKRLCFGDSHTPSVYRPGNLVCKNDGLTLYSILRDGLKNKIEEKSGIQVSNLEEVTIYAGNIDVRHHLCRQEDPVGSILEMARDLCLQASNLGIPKVRLVNLLPIETIERRLPKTGYYKGTPFYGSWEERNNLVETFNSEVDRMSHEFGFEVFKWPSAFRNEKNELDIEYMERPKSVHLSPQSYYWNLETNQQNLFHINQE